VSTAGGCFCMQMAFFYSQWESNWKWEDEQEWSIGKDVEVNYKLLSLRKVISRSAIRIDPLLFMEPESS
jgi:hypothetical protein